MNEEKEKSELMTCDEYLNATHKETV